MPKKHSIDEDIEEIRKLLKTKKLVIGTEKTLKNIKLGKVATVFLSANCPEKIAEDIDYYKKMGDFKVIKLKYSNDELGAICKKPFFISMLFVLKGEK